jgi:Tfp pilus assembly protein PilX
MIIKKNIMKSFNLKLQSGAVLAFSLLMLLLLNYVAIAK